MGRPPLTIDVSPKDRKELVKLLSGGVQQVRVVLRALALLQLAKGLVHRRLPRSSPSPPKRFGISAVAIGKTAWRQRSLKSSARVPPPYSTTVNDSGSSQWCVATRPKAVPAGRCVWSRRKRSHAGWCHVWEGKPSGFCSWTTTGSRGGKKCGA